VKVADGVTYNPQATGDPSLTCFRVSKTPFKRIVYDQNQFGQGPVVPRLTSYLCLPSTVAIQVRPG